jgi:hypothetical protein
MARAMNRPAFDQPRDLWEHDGSLRDIYIVGVSPEDWAFLFQTAADYGCRYSYQGQEMPLPSAAQIFSDRDGVHLLTIIVGSATVNCHFFVPEEIELDIDPREVIDAADHSEVLEFMEALAMETMKVISLTAENSQDAPYLSFNPASRSWTIFHPTVGTR